MKQFPFTDYDFWAYISAGFAFLYVIDYLLQLHLLDRTSWTIAQGVVTVSVAYTVGHLIASLSSALFERWLVEKRLGKPSVILFSTSIGPAWFRTLYPAYYATLPAETQNAVFTAAKSHGIAQPGEALFWLAFHKSRDDAEVMSRLNNFMNMYGFCRNTAMVALLTSLLLALSYPVLHAAIVNVFWSGAALLIAFGMFFRYLKFYRHYALEVFTSFAYAETSV